MLARLGSALILLGVIALVVFAVSLTSVPPDLTLLAAGSGLSALGLLLRLRAARQARAEPSRFRTLRKMIRRAPPGERD